MKQFLLLIALLFIILIPIHSLLSNKLTDLGSQGQKVCIHLVHSKILETKSLSFSPPQEMTALLCGENLKHSQEKTLYQSSGLIHLFVVSGSHFLVIERIAVFFKIPIFCRLVFFIFFLFFSGFQPPALRFVAQFLLFSTQLTWGNQFRSDQKTMFASFLVLVIFPDWITSFSFLLSWAASLAISCCSEIQNFFYQMIISQVLIFVVLFPILSQLQSPHLLSMAFNLILGGILSIVLLPMAFIALFSENALSAFDHFNRFIRHLVEFVFQFEWTRWLVVDLEITTPKVFFLIWILAIHYIAHVAFCAWIQNDLRRSHLAKEGL